MVTVSIHDLDMVKVSRFKQLYKSYSLYSDYECRRMGCVEFILWVVRTRIVSEGNYMCWCMSEDDMVLNLLKIDWYKNNLFLIKDMDMSCAPDEVKELVCMYGDLL